MSASPTPGPWGWVYDGSKDYSIGRAADPQGHNVANVYAYGRDYDRAEANCNLIAAAPDLLAALKGLHDDIAEYARINNLGGFDNHWMLAARAAIAKAEGRS